MSDQKGKGSVMGRAIEGCCSKQELFVLIPMNFRTKFQPLLNDIFELSRKVGNIRNQLTTLQGHITNNTVPDDMKGSIGTPAVQMSKEFKATVAARDELEDLENLTADHRKVMLKAMFGLKKKELAHLECKIDTDVCERKFDTAWEEKLLEYTEPTLSTVKPADKDKLVTSSETSNLPKWIRIEGENFISNKCKFIEKSIALGRAISTESKFRKDEKKMAGQKLATELTESMRTESTLGVKETVAADVKQALLAQPKGSKKTPPTQIKAPFEQPKQSIQKGSRRWQKRAREEAISRQVKKMRTAYGSVEPLIQVGKHGTVLATENAVSFFEKNASLYMKASPLARAQFKSSLTPIRILSNSILEQGV